MEFGLYILDNRGMLDHRQLYRMNYKMQVVWSFALLKGGLRV